MSDSPKLTRRPEWTALESNQVKTLRDQVGKFQTEIGQIRLRLQEERMRMEYMVAQMHERYALQLRVFLDGPQELKPANLRQVKVRENKVRMLPPGDNQSFFHCLDRENFVPERLQSAPDQGEIHRPVIQGKDGGSGARSLGF